MLSTVLLIIGILFNWLTNIPAIGNVFIGAGLFGLFIQFCPYPKSKTNGFEYDKDDINRKS